MPRTITTTLGRKAHCHVREIKTQPALCTPRLPRTYALGEFEVRAGPAGAPFLANIARPWFTFGDGGDHATTGGWVRVMGEALALGPSIPLCRPNSSQLCSAGQLGVILACGTPARDKPRLLNYVAQAPTTPTRCCGLAARPWRAKTCCFARASPRAATASARSRAHLWTR